VQDEHAPTRQDNRNVAMVLAEADMVAAKAKRDHLLRRFREGKNG
jgi:hypothetical protein